MKQIEKEELSYLAGFVDADGSIIAQLVANKDYKYKHQLRITLQVTQLNKRRWFLEELKKQIGAGTIRDRNTVSDYILVEIKPLCNLLKQLQPFLKLKKKQANLVLKIIEQLPSARDSQDKFLELCELVDQIAALNDTKKRKHTTETVRAVLKVLSQEE